MTFSRRWFKPIPDWPGYWINRKGSIYSEKRDVYLKWFDNIKFYPRVALYNGGARRQFFVHRLVAIVWIPNDDPSKRVEVNHHDWDVGNPEASNLSWMTPSENKKYNRRKPWRPAKSEADQIPCPF